MNAVTGYPQSALDAQPATKSRPSGRNLEWTGHLICICQEAACSLNPPFLLSSVTVRLWLARGSDDVNLLANNQSFGKVRAYPNYFNWIAISSGRLWPRSDLLPFGLIAGKRSVKSLFLKADNRYLVMARPRSQIGKRVRFKFKDRVRTIR